MYDFTKDGTIGGGLILRYLGNRNSGGIEYIDWNLVVQFAAIPFVKVIICFLLASICTIFILRQYNIKTLFKGKGILSEINNVKELQKRDKFILTSNKWLGRITRLVQSTPFNVPNASKEYRQYNLKRAGIKVPGGYRYMTAEEFNAIAICIGTVLMVFGAFTLIFINSMLGALLMLSVVVVIGVLPNRVVRSIVMERDREIKENFSDFYLMLHYVLMIGGQTPIDKLMKSYSKTTDSEEMVRFVDNCVAHIDTHGEYNATTLITKDYREIAEVGKLMRLIRQMYDGADVKQELIGFREELIKEKKYLISKRMDALVKKAQRSFNILMIILVQAIISAMALYLPDISILSTII